MADYVYTLDDATREKAVNELGEDPNELAGQVETFREWILQQPHLKCPTDTQYLLKYLRYAKFSQLRARTALEKYLKIKTELPQWFDNIDLGDEKIQAFLDSGFMLILPRAKDRPVVQIFREGAFDPKCKKYDQKSIFKAIFGMQFAVNNIEANLIHGTIMLDDFTQFNLQHQAYIGWDAMKKVTKCFQNAIPGRFKAFVEYNTGPLFEAIMAICKPLLSKKFQERMHVLSSMDMVYKVIRKEELPVDYLPDEYSGPSAGTVDQLIAECKRFALRPDVRDRILYESRPEWGIDESKRIQQAQESFRKLNVDG